MEQGLRLGFFLVLYEFLSPSCFSFSALFGGETGTSWPGLLHRLCGSEVLMGLRHHSIVVWDKKLIPSVFCTHHSLAK